MQNFNKISKSMTLTYRSQAGVWIGLNKILDQHLKLYQI